MDNNFFSKEPSRFPYKQGIRIVAIVLAVMLVAVLLIWGWKSGWFASKIKHQPSEPTATTTAPTQLGSLPQEQENNNGNAASSTEFSDDIEYIYFSDFYHAPSQDIPSGMKAISLPINVKTDAINYHDVSRKVDLSQSIDSLNNNGFAIIDNPWSKEATDYYAIFDKLKSDGLPLYISADFLFSYYNRSIEQAYKEVESEIFYESLWNFSHSMYERAKLRYEARLATIGQVNDALLEAERTETAFFATALALLSPSESQVIGKNLNDKGLFTQEDSKKFSFTPVPYLTQSIEEEKALVKALKPAKSPILLYDMDYGNFRVPDEYQVSEKLKNFYIAGRWLNSAFPINYQNADCPDCLLDRDDWRIDFIASQLITSDLYSDAQLKKEWAKIYKMTSFFTGLKDEYDYVKYYSALSGIFGKDYAADKVFESKDNPDLEISLDEARQAILDKPLLSIQGGKIENKDKQTGIGFKVLTDYYSASDLIYSSLSTPNVGNYLGQAVSKDNVTICAKDAPVRCNGFSLDALSCATDPIGASWQENTNYEGYEQARQKLLEAVKKDAIWQNNNYWFNIQLIRDYYASYGKGLGGAYDSFQWRERMQNSSQAIWTAMQLPSDQGVINTVANQATLANGTSENNGIAFEPSLLMVRDMIAGEDMIMSMVSALGIDSQARAVSLNLQESKEVLGKIAAMIEKQMSGEDISSDDEEFIRTWVGGWKIKTKANKTLMIGERTEYKPYTIEDISQFKLAIMAHNTAEGIKLFVGPTMYHQEHR